MKKIIILLIIIPTLNKSYSQWLTQSSEGKGSFLFKGTNIALDLPKTDFSFTINNLNNPVKIESDKDNHYIFYGAGVKAKSEDGIGNLFSSGDFVPSAGINGYLGIRLSNSYNKLPQEKQALIDKERIRIANKQSKEFKDKMKDIIDKEIKYYGLQDENMIKKIKREWKNNLQNLELQPFFEYLKSYKTDNATVANIIAELLVEIKDIEKEYTVEFGQIVKSSNDYYDVYIKNTLWKLSIFTFGGIDGSSFKRVDQINTDTLSKSFIKEDPRGGNWGIGLNYQIKRWKFGTTYSYRKTNNFSLLDKTDYKLTTTTTSGGQTLTQEKQITAYSGNYGEVEINELNADILYSLNLGKGSDTYALLNAYLRGNFFTRNIGLLPNSYNIGIGTYFFTKKSKFLGGLYIELPDVNDSFEKSKPSTDQNIRPALRRLTFGIVGKFSLNSLISSQ